ncbi:MAG: hypothetical protein JNK57_20295, partial [Planctomycetaceae bacterium]|nr:hypothetical protein [Planctomycetaceae bacterium]
MNSNHWPKQQIRRGILFSVSVLIAGWVCSLVANPIAATQTREDSTIIVSARNAEQAPQAADPSQVGNPPVVAERDARPFVLTAAHVHSLVTLCVGVLIVLIGIIGLKLNAFLALIVAALVVSLMSAGEWSEKVARVGSEFGGFAGRLGLVIALAAIIGQSFLASGCAERIVNVFVKILGEKRTPFALCGSGYIVGIPVFFDTVFYLLVPLARSAYLKAKGRYLACLLAVVAGGTATHTMVPPTPGPLLVASNLGVNVGTMLIVGSVISVFAASAGMI